MALKELEEAIISTGDIWLPEAHIKGAIKYSGHITTPRYAEMEDFIALKSVELVAQSKSWATRNKILKFIEEFEKKTGARLHEHQKEGVIGIVQYQLFILTGGPGTGKTTTLNCAAYVLRQCKKRCKIVFCAPTGKAARRITESTGEAASTAHHMLKLGYEKKEVSVVDADVIFMDESSMNDIDLTYSLFHLSLTGKKLIWVGDVDQIPSVGPGAILRDLIRSEVVPCVQLTKTFRQKDGALLHNIKEVRKGSCRFVRGSEFQELIMSKDVTNEKLDNVIAQLYLERVKQYGADNVAVIIPYRKAGYCSNRINSMLQRKLNAKSAGWKVSESLTLRIGDPVMQLVNRKECVNGEVGRVTDISSEGVKVKYEGGYVTYSGKEVEQLDLAYAMSVTKSQGSEYASVILVILNAHKNALNKNILYTGMSRAKKNLVLVTQNEAIIESVTHTASERKTFLAEKIRAIAGLGKEN